MLYVSVCTVACHEILSEMDKIFLFYKNITFLELQGIEEPIYHTSLANLLFKKYYNYITMSFPFELNVFSIGSNRFLLCKSDSHFQCSLALNPVRPRTCIGTQIHG